MKPFMLLAHSAQPETGLDCSVFVGHVFRQAAGIRLPHDSRAISAAAQPLADTELQPGDLVFFNTLHRTFSRVGIYPGDDRFLCMQRAAAPARSWSRYKSSPNDAGRGLLASPISVFVGIIPTFLVTWRAARSHDRPGLAVLR